MSSIELTKTMFERRPPLSAGEGVAATSNDMGNHTPTSSAYVNPGLVNNRTSDRTFRSDREAE